MASRGIATTQQVVSYAGRYAGTRADYDGRSDGTVVVVLAEKSADLTKHVVLPCRRTCRPSTQPVGEL